MSDHAWSQEQIAASVAGGLSADEAERLAAHAGGCPECAADLAAARRLDAELTGLFAPVRPTVGVEDRVIASLRGAKARRPLLTGWPRRAATMAAAIILLVSFGGVIAEVGDGGLPLPGDGGGYHKLKARLHGILIDDSDSIITTSVRNPRGEAEAKNLTNEDPGLDSNLDASVNVDRIDTQVVDSKVTQDPVGSNTHENINAAVQAAPSVGVQLGTSRPTNLRGFYADGPVTLKGTNFFDGSITLNGGTLSLATRSPADGKALGYGYYVPNTFWFLPAAAAPQSTPVAERGTALGNNETKAPAVPKAPVPPAATPEPANRRVVIRSGDIEFEIESFDSAVAAVTRLVAALNGAFVATVNSEKLPNGKVKGSVTVRMPPEHLDGLVHDLRRELGKGGELKGVAHRQPGRDQAVHRPGEPAAGGPDDGAAPAPDDQGGQGRDQAAARSRARAGRLADQDRGGRGRAALLREPRVAQHAHHHPGGEGDPRRRHARRERARAGRGRGRGRGQGVPAIAWPRWPRPRGG